LAFCHVERQPRYLFTQQKIVRDGKPGLADYVGCVAASTALGMTKVRKAFL